MTDAQKWYVELLAAQHVGSDDSRAGLFVAEKTGQDDSVAAVSAVIDVLRRTVPDSASPTARLRDTILRTARKGNMNHLTLGEDDLIMIIEKEHKIDWDSMNANTALRILDAYRQKVNWAKGYKNRYVHRR